MVLFNDDGGFARDNGRDKQILKWLEAGRTHVSIYTRLGISKQRFYKLLDRLKKEGKLNGR